MRLPPAYWIARLGAKGQAHLVWKADDLWAGELAISPDGATLAVTSLRIADELWIIQRH